MREASVGQTVRGERVKRLREKRDLTQGQLATYAGITQSYVSYIEREKTANVGTDALVPIARILETSIDYLVGLTDDPRSPMRAPIGALTPEEEGLIRDYRAIKNEDVRRFIVNAARDAAERAI